MPTKGRKTISDPKELRALAHPLRMRLLQLITREGRLTATQCAAAVGESVRLHAAFDRLYWFDATSGAALV